MVRKRLRKRADPKLIEEIDKNIDRNPLVQPPGSTWTTKGEHGETLLWGAHEDNSMVGHGMGSFKSAGIIAYIWLVQAGAQSGVWAVVTNPWNKRPMRVYPTVGMATEGEIERWKVKQGLV